MEAHSRNSKCQTKARLLARVSALLEVPFNSVHAVGALVTALDLTGQSEHYLQDGDAVGHETPVEIRGGGQSFSRVST
jgi:hypothetical protein